MTQDLICYGSLTRLWFATFPLFLWVRNHWMLMSCHLLHPTCLIQSIFGRQCECWRQMSLLCSIVQSVLWMASLHEWWTESFVTCPLPANWVKFFSQESLCQDKLLPPKKHSFCGLGPKWMHPHLCGRACLVSSYQPLLNFPSIVNWLIHLNLDVGNWWSERFWMLVLIAHCWL